MSATETIQENDVASWDPDEPLMAHVGEWRMNPYGSRFRAICGAPLMGIQAPPGHEPVCAICEETWFAFLFGLQP